MKLLFDQNVSPKLVSRLADLFPGSLHIRAVALESAPDIDVWNFARSEGFAIVSKDDDFRGLSVVHGSPPKVICLQIGNCTTSQAEAVIRSRFNEIEAFSADPDTATLIIS